MSERYDIAIVGYGSVGQTLAILLGLKGWSVGVFGPHAGQLFVQGRVQRGGVTGLLDDVGGRGWTLLSPFCDPAAQLDAAAAAFFASIGGISAQVGPDGPVRDVDGSYAKWFAAAGVEVVLQRPDFYIFGTASTANGAGKLISQLRRALTSGSSAV